MSQYFHPQAMVELCPIECFHHCL